MASPSRPWRIRTHRYFPLRSVDSYVETGNRWHSVRSAGTPLTGGEDTPTLKLTTALCGSVWEHTNGITFVTGAPALAALVTAPDGTTSIEIDVNIAHNAGLKTSGKKITGPRDAFISILRMVRAWADVAATSDDWAAVAATIEIWNTFAVKEKTAVRSLLESPGIDAGHILGQFLSTIDDDSRREEADETPEQWRYRWTTWLLGQNRIDLPYNRDEVQEILKDDLDPDDARLLLYQTIRQYDKPTEKDNAERTYREVTWAEEELIFGRMSRAFHNQALLFAHARYVDVTTEMAEGAQTVATAACMWSELRPAADRIRLLVQPGSETPMTELAGALDHLEEQTLRFQRTLTQDALHMRRAQVETATADPESDAKGQERLTIISRESEAVLSSTGALRQSLLEAPRRPAAYIIMSQRPSPTGAHLLAKINEGEEPYLGKAENLRQLVVLAGDRVYSSPDYVWLEFANHWIEAIPLFIKERIRVVDGVETAETVIDQKGMEESFREGMADPWSRNLFTTEMSGYTALARVLLSEDDPANADLSRDADFPRAWKVMQDGTSEDVARMSALLALVAEDLAGQINRKAEQDASERLEAFHAILFTGTGTAVGCEQHDVCRAIWNARDSGASWSDAVENAVSSVDSARFERLLAATRPWANLPRRQIPTLHVLTTQSANMTNGYVRSWVEESMAIANVVRAHDLDSAVKERMAGYSALIEELGEALIDELGLGVEIDTIMAREGVNHSSAVRRIVGANRMVQGQVGLLAVLKEATAEIGETWTGVEPAAVAGIMESHTTELRASALRNVQRRNAQDFEDAVEALKAKNPDASAGELAELVIEANPDYKADIEAFIRFAAREKLVEAWDAEHVHLKLTSRIETWLRQHQRLSLTTARKEVLTERGLNHLTLDPRYYYQAAGGGKRFNLIYTPSRVDLGPKERESVETWSQWVGGLDRQAAQTGRRVYGLINKAVKRFDSLAEPEVLKTGENASMASHFAYSNAMALMVNATGKGDVEELGDQMSLREDRKIHPAGEGYGGYCVPKDGLFLEFVLTLSEKIKLGQLGVEETYQEPVARLAREILSKREDFGSEYEWEEWAERKLAEQDGIEEIFGLRARKTPEGTIQVPVFQITRLAIVLENLGQPPLRDQRAVVKTLSARWGINTMIAGAEHVNRFMPFYKTWLTYDALRAARQADENTCADDDAVIVLSAEYKPDTQDGRFAVGMRKYEIYAGTDEHLRYSLGAQAGTIAALMFDGWEATASTRGDDDPELRKIARAWDVDMTSASGMAQLHEVFPGCASPSEIRLVSPMGLSTQDVMRYTGDTQIEKVADEVRAELYHAGLTDEDIQSNVATFGPRLTEWAKLRGRPGTAELADRLKGRIHALALAELGPLPSYEPCLNGADVFDVGISHKQVLALLEKPTELRDMMLFGRPHSALVLVDGGSGARRRTMTRLSVQRWFAAGDQTGRDSQYRSIGLGDDTIEGWRTQMREQRTRAQRITTAMEAGKKDRLENLFVSLISDVREKQEALLALEEEERLIRFKRDSEREHIVAQRLSDVASMTSPSEMALSHWLAIGGLFLMDGCTPAELEAQAEQFTGGMNKIYGQPGVADLEEAAEIVSVIERVFGVTFRQEGNIESSNKATEEVTSIALDTRKQLTIRAREMMSIRERADAFDAETTRLSCEKIGADDLIIAIRDALGDAGEFASNEAFGHMQAMTRALAVRLYDDLLPESDSGDFRERIGMLLTGRELDMDAMRLVCGGYEDIGAVPRFAQDVTERAHDDRWADEKRTAALESIASLTEFVDTIHVLDVTLSDRQMDPGDVDSPALWRNLATFFAETLNDHFYEYRPWAYSRGVGFEDYEGDTLYDLAVRHHHWLYGYIRTLIVTRTEMRSQAQVARELLLGTMTTNGETIEVQHAIGAGADSEIEAGWRAYNQLREIAFIRNDGFRLPMVFDEFDPTLIDAENRVNMSFMYPVGRTHVSRALTEGPTLARKLVTEGQPAANILITRMLESRDNRLYANDGHFYVGRETCIAALVKHWGLNVSGAEAVADREMGPKGIRVAARFAEPVMVSIVFPFHGHPLYMNGTLEKFGLPYSSQSRYHTWTTYDKAKYPDIFTEGCGVTIPGETDWLHGWTKKRARTKVMAEIRAGRDGFDGLEPFSATHRIVMLKDAAESGGRGQKAFVLRNVDGTIDEDAMTEAVEFLYQISLVHNVAVQEVIVSTPEAWATEEFMRGFIDRQITEWHRPIIRDRQPQTPLFGSFRVIFSTDRPTAWDRERHWHASHWITLNSTQLITNVGRGGTLESLSPSDIRSEHRADILAALENTGRKAMEAMAVYEERTAERYEAETGEKVGQDLTGVSYGVPRYLMIDFLVRPQFSRPGELVEVVPHVDDSGRRTGSRFILHDAEGPFDGEISGWDVVLIEPNIGIGLWDRLSIREQEIERIRTEQSGDEMNWDRVGENARIVLRDMARAGADYRSALTKK
jgi:hypothetical protein